jgi:DNA polymerase-1
MTSDWRDLPFREIWALDSEYYPGPGFANGGVQGDQITPLCVVALEMRSGRVVRKWQDELGPAPPYSIGPDSVVMGYMVTAELGTHLALNWPQPANALDPYVEFRHYVNDGSIEQNEREKGEAGFYSLAGALRYFCEDPIDTAHKKEMRDRILQGPPFTAEERAAVLDYCEEDVHALARLVPHIVPTIRSLPHALFRGKFQWEIAKQERRGLPVDQLLLTRFRSQWSPLKCDLVTARDRFGIYEIVGGVPHWRKKEFANFLLRNNLHLVWRRLASGAFDESDEAFKELEGANPEVRELRQLRYTLSQLKLNDLQVGRDGRNRALLGAYGTKTSRNAFSNTKYMFGPAKWLRFLVAAPADRVLIHRDYSQQEVTIAAILSNDPVLLTACASGDVYRGMAEQLGFDPEAPGVRQLFKTVVLAILYGLQARSLAMLTGLSLYEAGEILARSRASFRVFEDYVRRVQDHAGLNLEISTPFGWVMQCPPEINPRTVRNFPVQSSAAEIYRVAVILAERRGIQLVASIHDALIAEADPQDVDDVSAALDRAMRDAASIVLRGHELPTDVQIVAPGEHFFEKNGVDMWRTVLGLLDKLEAA